MPFLWRSKAAAHDGANGILPPVAEIMSSETNSQMIGSAASMPAESYINMHAGNLQEVRRLGLGN